MRWFYTEALFISETTVSRLSLLSARLRSLRDFCRIILIISLRVRRRDWSFERKQERRVRVCQLTSTLLRESPQWIISAVGERLSWAGLISKIIDWAYNTWLGQPTVEPTQQSTVEPGVVPSLHVTEIRSQIIQTVGGCFENTIDKNKFYILLSEILMMTVIFSADNILLYGMYHLSFILNLP